MKLLEGKTAIVTGAARGIGKAIALRFAQEGANVAFTDLAIDDNAKATEAEIAALGVKVKAYASNAANFEDTHTVVENIVKDFGRIDILVNNAGITRDGLMMRMSEQQWDMVINVNLKSAFNFVHAVTPVMMKQKSGSIINMSSVVGVSGNAGQANYSASKAGMIGLAKSISAELGSRGIRANAIAPGFIITEMTAQLPEEVRKEWAEKIPLRRGGTPQDVANVCVFLGSELSSYVSGQVINVNLKSAFNFVHAVTPVMMKQKSGSIINMSSVVGVSGNAGQSNYSASKAGMIGLAKSISAELGSRGIRANAIAPGFIITEMTAQLPEEVRKEWAEKIPLRRGGTPEDVANVCVFLGSELSSYVSGQVINVCGGMNR